MEGCRSGQTARLGKAMALTGTEVRIFYPPPKIKDVTVTFNVSLTAHGFHRDEILANLVLYTGVQIAENEFGVAPATYVRHIKGLGFNTEAERLQFILTFVNKLRYCFPTDRDFNWGYDPNSFQY